MPRHPDPHPATSERVYGDDEAAWLAACARYRQQKKRKFMQAVDYLEVARELGYGRVAGSPRA